jgi:hypothetical protein
MEGACRLQANFRDPSCGTCRGQISGHCLHCVSGKALRCMIDACGNVQVGAQGGIVDTTDFPASAAMTKAKDWQPTTQSAHATATASDSSGAKVMSNAK